MLLVKIIVVALETDVITQIPFLKLIRSGTNRVCAEVIVCVNKGFGNNIIIVVGKIIQQTGIGDARSDFHGIFVYSFDLGHAGCVQSRSREGFRVFERCDDIGRGHLISVVEFNTLAQRERPLHFVLNRVAFRQVTDRIQRCIVNPH